MYLVVDVLRGVIVYRGNEFTIEDVVEQMKELYSEYPSYLPYSDNVDITEIDFDSEFVYIGLNDYSKSKWFKLDELSLLVDVLYSLNKDL